MEKKILRSMRALNATDKMKRMAVDNERIVKRKNVWDGKEYEEEYRKYAVYLRCQNLSGIIKVAVFLPKDILNGIITPKYEIFLDVRNEAYVTRELAADGTEVRWSNAKIENLGHHMLWNYFSRSDKYAWINPEGNETIKRLTPEKIGGYQGILKWQNGINKKKIAEAEKRQTEPWDKAMELVPEPPAGFEKWWKKEGIRENYIIYEYSKNVTSGYCTYCEKDVPIKNPHFNKEGKCPVCHNNVTYKSAGKMASIGTFRYNVQLIQKIEGGYVIRIFEVSKKIPRGNYRNQEYYISEHQRTLAYENSTETYDWLYYKNKYMRWIKSEYSNYSTVSLVYKRNIAQLEKTALKHTALPIMIRHEKFINCARYIRSERYNTAIEPLVKIGMIKLAKALINSLYDDNLLAQNEKELAKLLKIDKARLKRLKAMDGAICHMRWLQKEKTQNTIWKDEMIKYFGDKGISVESLNFISGNMTYEKIWNYIVKQSKDSNDTASHLISTWQDYLSMAKRAKKNINLEKVYKPASIRAAHTDMIAFFAGEDMKKAAAMWGKKYKKVDTVCSELTKYEYKDKKYAIVAPKSILDIVREGTILDHCVHSCDIYYDRMNKRETYLLFLRKAADIDTPWYTLEIEPHGQIRQKRTTGDNQNKDFDEALEFLKKWQRAITKRLSKKDWELGEKSDRLRKEEYKKLRKDGNKIWHGKLAGKLLADVLEADFMALEEPEQNNQQVV